MCTPSTSKAMKRGSLGRVADPDRRRRRSAPRPAHCRWIDDQGHEWLFTRQGGTLVVERPVRTESVMIQFPDLPSQGTCGSRGEAWVLFRTADGHLFHCSVSREVGLMDFQKPKRPSGGVRNLNTHVRTFLDPEDCGCGGSLAIKGGIDGEVGR